MNENKYDVSIDFSLYTYDETPKLDDKAKQIVSKIIKDYLSRQLSKDLKDKYDSVDHELVFSVPDPDYINVTITDKK